MKDQLFRKTFAEISLQNIKYNCRTLQGLSRDSDFFCPMIKSFAYGHGDIEVCKALIEEGVTRVGVALVEEGVRLREANIKTLKFWCLALLRNKGLKPC